MSDTIMYECDCCGGLYMIDELYLVDAEVLYCNDCLKQIGEDYE